MLGKFVYSNPTKLYFGENSLENLPQELACYGKKCHAGIWRRLD